jgi:hypothetical protein
MRKKATELVDHITAEPRQTRGLVHRTKRARYDKDEVDILLDKYVENLVKSQAIVPLQANAPMIDDEFWIRNIPPRIISPSNHKEDFWSDKKTRSLFDCTDENETTDAWLRESIEHLMKAFNTTDGHKLLVSNGDKTNRCSAYEAGFLRRWALYLMRAYITTWTTIS